ncbi:MAG: hypothetical protein J6X44_04995, partial [Thermoguttaceae bacterium]|nr:hypothetical protein [Thermoguttaceae bacterium]
MRKIFAISTVLTAVASTLFTASFAYCADKTRTLPENPPSWARNDEGFAVSEVNIDGRTATRVVHKTPTDWAVRIPGVVQVEPGDLFELTCQIKNVGSSSCQTGVILYDERGDSLDWSYGGSEIRVQDDWQTVSSRFVVPSGVAKIEARIIGQGETDVYVDSYEIKETGKLKLDAVKGTRNVKNKYISVDFNLENASFTIRDLRS